MKIKGEVFKRFQEFKALVENQIGKKIKVLWLENGGENISNENKDLRARVGHQERVDNSLQPTTK